uniref:Bs4C-S protein n=1 Tax=Capsicum pubescens TaxID=113210 RepID=K7WDA4_9SOLA|nr:Bs4C-S protein [Capsicum pubescens]
MEFDLRYFILILANMIKSILSSISDNWDPFHIFHDHPSFIVFINKLFFLFIFSFIFSITRITLHHPNIRIRIRTTTSADLSKSFNILCLASLLLPQMLFWYFFFITITLSSCSSWIGNAWASFRGRTLHIFSTIFPAVSIFINVEFDRNNVSQQHETQTNRLLV